jgi:hypothetical protein
MSKTNFIDGSPVTPAFLNAINNPIYKESPSENGEIPFPPAFSKTTGKPSQYFRNSCMRGTNPFSLGSWDFISFTTANLGNRNESAACGLNLDTSLTNFSGVVLANACGDPVRGAWIWNAAGATPAIGQKFGLYVNYQFLKSARLYSKSAGVVEEEEITAQIEVKNDNVNGTSVATLKASISLANLSALVSDGRVEILETSPDLVVAPGESGFLWLRYLIKQSRIIVNATSPIVPTFSFEMVSNGSFNMSILGLGVFSGNSFGKALPMDDDAEAAVAFRKTLSGGASIQGRFMSREVAVWDNGNSTLNARLYVKLPTNMSVAGTPVLYIAANSVWRRTNISDAGPNADADVSSSATYTFVGFQDDFAIIDLRVPGGSYAPSSLMTGEIYFLDVSIYYSLRASGTP